VGLIARALEMAGIRTTLTSWSKGTILRTLPPRAVITSLPRGMTLGHPNDEGQQNRILKKTLELLSLDAPLKSIILDEK